MLVQQTKYSIEKILNKIQSGKLALPDFQRDFVWSPTQVSDLLNSIAKEWPVGSLLLLTGPQDFAFRAIDSAPAIEYSQLDMYVLDGQQRITALYHAFMDVSNYVFYVDFSTIKYGEYDDLVKFSRRASFERRYRTQEMRARSSIALVYEIGRNADFNSWLECVQNKVDKNEYLRIRENKLSGLQIKNYNLLAMELEQDIELEALAKIFETLNKTGVKLNAFDLLVAKLYPAKFNLRKRWESAIEENDELKKFAVDGLEIVKLIALLVREIQGKRASLGVRQGDLLRLRSQFLEDYWDDALSLYCTALKLVSKFGVVSSDLIPSWAMVLGVAVKCRLRRRTEDVFLWWLRNLSNQNFSQAANTKIITEIDAMISGDSDYDLDRITKDLVDLLDLPVRSNGLAARGVASLLILSGATDPITRTPLKCAKDVAFLEIKDDGRLGAVSRETLIRDMILVDFESVSAARRMSSRQVDSEFVDALESQGIGHVGHGKRDKIIDSVVRGCHELI